MNKVHMVRIEIDDNDQEISKIEQALYKNIVIEFSDDLAKLPKQELERFLLEYNAYIQEFYDNHDESCYPVCMAEFYNNDFQEIDREM